MGSKLKTGHLQYFARGFLSKKWKEGFFVLYEDSTIQLFEKPSDKKPELTIRIKDVAQYLSVGPFTRAIPNRPTLPPRGDENLIISIPKDMNRKEKEILWLICHDLSQLNDWMKAIVSTLPPPPGPPGGQQGPPQPGAPSAPGGQQGQPQPGAPPPYPSNDGDKLYRPMGPPIGGIPSGNGGGGPPPQNRPPQGYPPQGGYGGAPYPQQGGPGHQQGYGNRYMDTNRNPQGGNGHTTVVVQSPQQQPMYGGYGRGGYSGGDLALGN